MEVKNNFFYFLNSCVLIYYTLTTKISTCPRGEIGRHKGLKILALLVPFITAEGTILKMNKLSIISDKTLVL